MVELNMPITLFLLVLCYSSQLGQHPMADVGHEQSRVAHTPEVP
jgi:hypothetical protein